jgi:PHD/YefM family antitoxin component YafN of YafNO toxin-antitoxin module
MSIVPTIRPISELKNTASIASLCHDVKEPVFITKNGYSDLVIMSIDTYERNMAMLEIYSKLDEAEEQLTTGAPTKSHKEIISSLRRRVNAKL